MTPSDSSPDNNRGGENAALMARAWEELQTKSGLADATWGLRQAAWSVDMKLGTIVFTRESGGTATALVQIIGTHADDGTWLWGWDHPSVPEPLAEHARKVLAYGQEHAINDLIARKLSCSELRAWEFTALACHLAGAQGAYRGPAGSARVFMTYENVTLRGPGAS